MIALLRCRHKNPAGRRHVLRAGGILALAACLMIAPAVFGHVLQTPHVLDLMVGTLSGSRSLRVQQTVWLAEGAGERGEIRYLETLNYLFPGRFRSESRHEQSERILVANHGRSVTVIDAAVAAERENRFDVYKDLLLHDSRNAILRNLIKWGVDIGVSSLGLWEENVVYVIGAQYPDTAASQVWVDKERFLPLRWISRQPHPSEPDHLQQIEFVYREWRQHGGTWYPMRIDTYLDGRLIRQSRVDHIEVDAVASDDMFDVDRLLTTSRPAPPAAPAVPRLDDLQRPIDTGKQP